MTTMLLDDAKAFREIDRSDMLGIMEKTSARLAPPVDALSTCKGQFGTIENVVFGGVGGSGIVGDILSDCCRGLADVPVSVCRILRIPKFVGKRTLFVAVSYSGETPETLGQLEQAMKQGAKVAAITSGGKLLSKAKNDRLPYVRVPSNLLPRVALPELVAAAVFVMDSANLLINSSRLLSEAAKELGDMVEKVKLAVPAGQNDAKRMAQALVGRLPLLIGDEAYGSVIRRFKNELNENSKMPAAYYLLPEGYHDDIEGLSALRQQVITQPIILRTRNETDGQMRTRERLVRLLGKLKFPPVLDFQGNGMDTLSELLTAITFADFVSLYLAILRGVDPAELSLIPEFRETMRGK